MDSVPHAARSRKLSHRLARSGLSCLQNLKLLIWDQQSGGSQNPRYRVSVPCSNCVAISRRVDEPDVVISRAELTEFEAREEVEVTLAPRGTPGRSIRGESLEFRIRPTPGGSQTP